MKIRRPIIVGISLVIAAAAWAMPFAAPVDWSYWASGVWCAILVYALWFMEGKVFGLHWVRHWPCGILLLQLLFSSRGDKAGRVSRDNLDENGATIWMRRSSRAEG